MSRKGRFACRWAVAVMAVLWAAACAGTDSEQAADPPALLARTLRLVEEARPFRPRFSGVRNHAECREEPGRMTPSMRCRPVDRETLHRAARLAAELHRLEAAFPHDPDLVRARSLLGLFTAEPALSVGREVERLRDALRRHDASPELRNDLAAMLLVRTELLDAPADALAALRHATDALALRSPFPEAELNRALALEMLTLWSASLEPWRRAGKGTVAEGWRIEAREGLQRCARLARRARAAIAGHSAPEGPMSVAWVARHPLDARRQVEAQLGRWAEASERGRHREASEAIASANRTARLLAEATGDRLGLESVQRIGAARDGDLRTLVEGHAAFHAARGGGIYSDCSGRSLAQAERALSDAGSPFRGWAVLDGAICAYFDKDFHLAETKLAELAEMIQDRPYPALAGRRSWILGLVRMVQGRYDEAMASFRTARDAFEGVGEQEHAVYLDALIAKTYRYLGAHDLAWDHRLRALRGRAGISSPERVFTIFEETVEALRAAGEERQVLPFLEEQLAAAGQAAGNGDGDLLVYTLIDRRETLLDLGRKDEADADLARAEQAWARLEPGDESRRRLRLELDFHHALAAGDDAARLAAIRRGLEFFQQRLDVPGDRIQVLALHREEAAVHQRAGRLAQAEEALLLSLAEAEAQRGQLMVPELRASFLDEMREIHERMVEIQLDGRGDPRRTLHFVERSSNRVLHDLLERSASPLSENGDEGWQDLIEELPEHSLVVRYGRLRDRLLVWVISRDGIGFEERNLPRRLLADRLGSLRQLLRDPAAGALLDTVLADLGANLLPRAVHHLPDGGSLVFVPDDSIAGVPFAALRDEQGRYLGDRFTISAAPSLEVYRRAMERGGAWSAPVAGSILVVADPRFDRGLFPAMQPLAGARLAGERLGTIHPGATVITGQAATEPGLMEALAGHRVFHFEGHAVTDPANGARNGLLLAPADPARPDRESSLLRAEELADLDLAHVRLVVLAACSTAVGLYPESREVASLATSFLAAGAPAVVASLWDVEDAAAATLFEEFHRRLAAGDPPAAALRAAQAAMRESGDQRLSHPAAWAGFELFGHGNLSNRVRPLRRKGENQ